VRFVDDVSRRQVRAREWFAPRAELEAGAGAVVVPPSLGSRLAAWTLYPFYILGRLAEWNGGMDPGRWPQPSSTLSRNLLYSVDGLLGGIHVPVFGVLVLIVVGVGAWNLVGMFTMDQVRTFAATDWKDPMTYGVRPLAVLLSLVGIAVAVLMVFVTALGVLANYVLLRAARRILYGLAMTYVAGPGAPAWAVEHKHNIVALPIPAGVTTLTFSMSNELRRATIAAAHEATQAKLKLLLPEEMATT
jgi:hypothetical protein